jgi:hypothetical protein
VPQRTDRRDTKLYDDFVTVVAERVRSSEDDAKLAWGSLGNVVWRYRDTQDSISFRTAGAWIATIRNETSGEVLDMSYMKYYMSSPEGIVPDWIKKGMKKLGWKPYSWMGEAL